MFLLQGDSKEAMLFTGQNGLQMEGGSEPKNTSSGVTFDFIHFSTASVGKFSKKCFAFLNSIILSNYRPLTTFILSFHPWARLRGLRYCAITQSAGYGRTRRDLVHADLTTYTAWNMICCTRTVTDPGEGPAPRLIFRPNWGWKGQQIFFWRPAFPLPQPPSPRYLKVWIQYYRVRVYAHREAKY